MNPAPASNWRQRGARDKAVERGRSLLRLAAGYGQTSGAQQALMDGVLLGTINPLFAGYTRGQPVVRFAAVQGAVAAAAFGGLTIASNNLPRGAANFLTNQNILAGWGNVAPPPPPAAPAPVPAPAPAAPPAPAPAPAPPPALALALAPVPASALALLAAAALQALDALSADDDDDDDDDDEEEE